MSSIVELLPNLWMGNYEDCGNLLSFNECNINTIVNCCNREPFIFNKIVRQDIMFSNKDNLDEIIEKINEVVHFINEQIRQNKYILIYSLKKDQKASTIIACYMMKYGKMDPTNVINSICSKKHNEFYPILHFKTVLFKYYESIQY